MKTCARGLKPGLQSLEGTARASHPLLFHLPHHHMCSRRHLFSQNQTASFYFGLPPVPQLSLAEEEPVFVTQTETGEQHPLWN